MRVLSAAWFATLVAASATGGSAPAAGTAEPGQARSSACAGDCRSREAGYRWAERYAIDDAGRCKGRSLEFADGCREFVDELAARGDNDEDSADYDDNNNDDGYDDNDNNNNNDDDYDDNDDNDEDDNDDGDGDGMLSA